MRAHLSRQIILDRILNDLSTGLNSSHHTSRLLRHTYLMQDLSLSCDIIKSILQTIGDLFLLLRNSISYL